MSFRTAPIEAIGVDEPVDAVVGRLILMHLTDPLAALRHLAAQVRTGGLIAFCETDLTGFYTVPDLPLWRTLKDAATTVFEGVGIDPAFGCKLHRLFRRAGLGSPRLALGAPLGGADDTDMVAHALEYCCRRVFQGPPQRQVRDGVEPG